MSDPPINVLRSLREMLAEIYEDHFDEISDDEMDAGVIVLATLDRLSAGPLSPNDGSKP